VPDSAAVARRAYPSRRPASGRELVERGFPEDVPLASELDAGSLAPELVHERFEVADL
jgi:hypothetical protein